VRWPHSLWRAVIVIGLIAVSLPVAAESQTRHPRRRVPPPPTQGYFESYFGTSTVELHGLRVPVVIKTEAHERILLLASYWAMMMNTQLRVVSAMDHIHARKSAHYAGLAVDFQGARKDLDGLALWFKKWGYRVYWRQRGHWNHVHVEEVQHE
jgi:hypothetical protein